MKTHRRWTLDLLLVVAGAVAALAVILLDVPGSIARSLLVIPLIVLYPGYALLAAVFPEKRSDIESDKMGPDRTLTKPTPHTAGILYSVRLVLAAASSLIIVGGVALATNFLGLGFAARPIGIAVFVVTILFTAVALARRAMLPSEARAGLPPLSVITGSAATTATSFGSPLSGDARDSSVSLAVNALLVVGVIAFVSSVGFAMVETQQPEADFTEAYLVTENESGYQTSGYPQQLSQGEATPITLALENHEHESQTYTVVSELQRLDRTANGSQVVEERELYRTQQTVEDGETAYIQRDVTPTMSGDSLRLVFHVYQGDAPEDADRETAYRTVQLVFSTGSGADSQSVQPQTVGGTSA